MARDEEGGKAVFIGGMQLPWKLTPEMEKAMNEEKLKLNVKWPPSEKISKPIIGACRTWATHPHVPDALVNRAANYDVHESGDRSNAPSFESWGSVMEHFVLTSKPEYSLIWPQLRRKPKPKAITKWEQVVVDIHRANVERARNGPFYCDLADDAFVKKEQKTAEPPDTFSAMPKYSDKYLKKARTEPNLAAHPLPYVKELFPKELWSTIDPSDTTYADEQRAKRFKKMKKQPLKHMRQKKSSNVDKPVDKAEDELFGPRSPAKIVVDEDGEVNEDEEEQGNDQDDDFNEDDDDDNDDYNAEKYFDGGDDDFGGDEGFGGDAGDDMF
ncbi:hypothetical protein NA57DRAFT_57623 [Rhizodiscina lignyota]|uniref:DNA-directed RNA polymerase III subunit n=1 Tax=Rhizodiscina lignyota TaxID=1504668 RepID=A0A9P4M8P0_9PEZI|nr:hypothetical protein NA57DRAFT_57623 [Rhizodiscina lignyota]